MTDDELCNLNALLVSLHQQHYALRKMDFINITNLEEDWQQFRIRKAITLLDEAIDHVFEVIRLLTTDEQ